MISPLPQSFFLIHFCGRVMLSSARRQTSSRAAVNASRGLPLCFRMVTVIGCSGRSLDEGLAWARSSRLLAAGSSVRKTAALALMDVAYIPRILDDTLVDLLNSFPALLINGPRASGKTTSAARLAASVMRLDVPAVARVVEADPDAAFRRMDELVLLDEWQETS